MGKERDNSGDFLDWVGPDISASIFRTFDHPADLLRASLAKRSWRRFVVENDFCRKLCERLCPETATFADAVEVSRSAPLSPRSSPSPADSPESSDDADARAAQAEFRIYSYLLGALVSATPSVDCILHCVGASSTDNFPDETIENTLEPQDRINLRPSYWSSGGQDEDSVPETLTYRLSSDICVVHEIRIQPFKAYFQIGQPIYSPRMVRFRMGHCKLPLESESFVTDEDENQAVIADENYVWTYTSPEFPVLQENSLQTFKLPRPVLCIGGVVKIELLGRVQRQASDDRYYICVCHAQVVGCSLSPVYMVDISNSGSHVVLKYLPAARGMCSEALMQDDTLESLEWNALLTRYKQTRHLAIMNLLLGPAQINELDDIDGGGV
uniref:Uncharacterized protein n=1 Tax=Avena sativa TaxID=4498 RepID=A0ACD5WR10_AVESA